MVEILIVALPVAGGVIVWLIRQERRLTRIETNICWIKKEISKCLPAPETGK